MRNYVKTASVKSDLGGGHTVAQGTREQPFPTVLSTVNIWVVPIILVCTVLYGNLLDYFNMKNIGGKKYSNIRRSNARIHPHPHISRRPDSIYCFGLLQTNADEITI